MLATALFALVGSVAHANITYTFFGGAVGTGSFSGSVTTDGTIGFLNPGNILDWTINLDGNPGGTFTLFGPLSGNNSGYGSTNNILFTTSGGGLFADFANTGYALFQNPSLGSGQNYFCFAGSGQICGGIVGPAITLGTNVFGVNGRVETAGRVQVGGASVPEPETLVLLGIGLIGLIATRRARRA
jgi:hypothetical protein